MSESEYEDRENILKERIEEELKLKYHKVPWFWFIFNFAVYGYLFPKIAIADQSMPWVTKIAIILGLLFFVGGIFFLFLSMKKHYELIYKNGN